jgi:hypothetical protein
MATGDIAAVRAVYAGAPGGLTDFFGRVDNIRANLRYDGAPEIVDDRAELNFTLILKYDLRKPRTENLTAQFIYHAVLRREAGTWHIEKLTQRNP